jgi:hypothetical protein
MAYISRNGNDDQLDTPTGLEYINILRKVTDLHQKPRHLIKSPDIKIQFIPKKLS